MSNPIQILPKHLIKQLNTYFAKDERSCMEKLSSLTHLLTVEKKRNKTLAF